MGYVIKWNPNEPRANSGRWIYGTVVSTAEGKHGGSPVRPKGSGGKSRRIGGAKRRSGGGRHHKAFTGAGMKLFAQITKVDEEKRLVYGRAVKEEPDKADEIFDYATSKPYFEAWSKEWSNDTDGKSLGNVRAMHGKVLAGKLTQIDFADTEQAIDIAAKILDDVEWTKVIEGGYRGFSIGGSYVGERKTEKIGDREVKRYTANPNEISLVDSPCVPSAKFFDIIKADGHTDKVEFKPQVKAEPDPKASTAEPEAKVAASGTNEPATVRGEPEQVDDFVKLLNEHKLSMSDAITAVKAAVTAGVIADMVKTADELTVEKREFSSEERKKSAKAGHALPDGSFPIENTSDLHNAVQAYGRAKDKAKAKAHIIARAKALGATASLPEAWTKEKEKSANGELKKGLYTVSEFAECLACLCGIARSAEYDLQEEEDDSAVPMKLRNAIDDLIEIFKEMSDEESEELLEELKEHAGVGEDDEIEMALEQALRVGDLKKRLADPELPVTELATIASEYEVPLTAKALGDYPALVKAIIEKAGARHSKVDAEHLQQAHDHLVGMGAECYGADGEKVAGGELKKMTGTIATLTEEVAKLKAQPMPHVMLRLAPSKAEANGSIARDDSWVTSLPYEKLMKLPGGMVDWDASVRLLQHLKPGAVQTASS